MWTQLKTWIKRRRTLREDESATATGDMPLSAAQADMSILMVCMGNICRSPMAEGLLRKWSAEYLSELLVYVDSAGTHSYHIGSPPDPRAQAAAMNRGIEIENLKARQLVAEDFETHDLLIAMDRENLEYMHEIAPEGRLDKARLLLDFSASRRGGDVPDPYYGGSSGFDRVLDLLEEGMEGLLSEIQGRAAARRRPVGR